MVAARNTSRHRHVRAVSTDAIASAHSVPMDILIFLLLLGLVFIAFLTVLGFACFVGSLACRILTILYSPTPSEQDEQREIRKLLRPSGTRHGND